MSLRQQWENLVLVLVIGLVSPVALADDAPPAVEITNVKFQGSGCLPGTVSTLLSPDKQALTVIYDNFSVQHVGESNRYEFEAVRCLTRLRLAVPAGYQMAIVSGVARGFADMDAGAMGFVSNSFGFNPFGLLSHNATLRIPGEYHDSYTHQFDMPLRKISWSSCWGRERNLIIDSTLAVRTRQLDQAAVLTQDSSDYAVEHEYGLIWRQCEARPAKAFVAVCRAQYSAPSQSTPIEIVGQATARTANQATAQARRQAQRRCEKRSRHVDGGECTIAADACQTSAL